MAIRRMWAEVGVEEIDMMPVIAGTHTEEWWREKARNENILVKLKEDSTNSRNNGELQIEPCTDVGDVPIGVLRSIAGHPTAFPSKFMARVAVRAYDCNVDGNPDGRTGELTAADIGSKIAPDANSKAVITNSGAGTTAYQNPDTGSARVVGGTYANPRIAFDFIDHFR